MKLILIKKYPFAVAGVSAVLILSATWLIRSFDTKSPQLPITANQQLSGGPLNFQFVLPAPAVAEKTNSLRQEIITALDQKTPPAQRTELVVALPSDLTEAEYLALLKEVITPPEKVFSEAWHSSYVHEICKVLQGIPSCHDHFAQTLATVAANRTFPEVYRDYACQHLRVLWQSSLDPSALGVAQPRNQAIQETFRLLLTERPEMSAQALLGLHELRHNVGSPAISDQEINALANAVLSSTDRATSSHLPSRMTAVRIMSERNLPQARETLKSLASSPQEHNLVRASAIGAIGHAAVPEDEVFLKSLAPDNFLIAEAIQNALKQF
jgi:hypothetical protein